MSYKGRRGVVIVECAVSMNAHTHKLIQNEIEKAMRNLHAEQNKLRQSAMLMDKLGVEYNISRVNAAYRESDAAIDWFSRLNPEA